ncbi:hypothetical protein [Amycolatopsis sp. WAC 01375]|uniref:hypothetical protein n=1 Tax=Amycolatopsis sp. WAC 01375 TaxID=2203194 RepID=UPI0011CF7D1D|nr:hypothetical protein [Amycolatopsis sp. WAC 01375]
MKIVFVSCPEGALELMRQPSLFSGENRIIEYLGRASVVPHLGEGLAVRDMLDYLPLRCHGVGRRRSGQDVQRVGGTVEGQ